MIFKRLEIYCVFSTDLRECYVWKYKKKVKQIVVKLQPPFPANQAADDARTC